jgi:hypothetical protein
MQFVHNHPYITAFLAIILFNVIFKRILKSKQSPLGMMLIGMLSLIGQACSPFSGAVNKEISNCYYYSKTRSQIRYSPAGNWFELGNTEVKADVNSFVPLAMHYARDKDHVFFKHHIIDKEIDINTFKAQERLGFDKNHVYIPLEYMAYTVRDTLPESQIMFVLQGADPTTYHETEDGDWGKDDKNWFYGYKMIDVDYHSFTSVNEFFCKDDHRVYTRTYFNITPCEINPNTLKKIDKKYIADDKYIYSFEEWVDGEEVNKLFKYSYQSFESIDVSHDAYLFVDDKVIFDGKLIETAHRKQFKIMDTEMRGYAKDDKHAYYSGKIIPDADVQTFRLYKCEYYSTDGNSVYYLGEKIEGADAATFGPTENSNWLHRDKNHVYDEGKIREDKPKV